MADTIRTSSYLRGTDFIDNSVGAISAQMQRDFVVSAFAKSSTSDPGVNDDGVSTSGNGSFDVGSRWVNTSAGTHWVCLDNRTGAAVWKQIWDSTNRSANVVLAGPSSGAAAAPTWRALTAADLPGTGAIGAGSANFYQTGNVYPGAVTAAFTTSSLSLSANTAYFVPFIIGQTMTATALVCTLTSVVGTKHVRMGIYKSDGTAGKPSTLVVDGGSSTMSGSAPIDVSQTISQSLGPNALYWLAIVSDAAPSISAFIPNGCMLVPGGWTTVSSATFTNAPVLGYLASFTYGSFPNPWTATLSSITTNVPAIGIKF
jgi:hypothetical protein